MGTHYQATSVAWHDAQQLLGHGRQRLLVSVDQRVRMRERVLSARGNGKKPMRFKVFMSHGRITHA